MNESLTKLEEAVLLWYYVRKMHNELREMSIAHPNDSFSNVNERTIKEIGELGYVVVYLDQAVAKYIGGQEPEVMVLDRAAGWFDDDIEEYEEQIEKLKVEMEEHKRNAWICSRCGRNNLGYLDKCFECRQEK